MLALAGVATLRLQGDFGHGFVGNRGAGKNRTRTRKSARRLRADALVMGLLVSDAIRLLNVVGSRTSSACLSRKRCRIRPRAGRWKSWSRARGNASKTWIPCSRISTSDVVIARRSLLQRCRAGTKTPSGHENAVRTPHTLLRSRDPAEGKPLLRAAAPRPSSEGRLEGLPRPAHRAGRAALIYWIVGVRLQLA